MLEYTKSSKELFTMDQSEIKEKLERKLRTSITSAEWIDLREQGYVREFQAGISDWDEFAGNVDEVLKRLRKHLERTHLEQAGELEEYQEAERKSAAVEPPVKQPNLSGRNSARGSARSSLNRLRTRGRTSGKSPVHGALMPRGGLDGTLAQWVYLLAVELWVPADEIANHYRSIQTAMSHESPPPKTSERAFEVARFVWDSELADGERAPWPDLCARWNQRPLAKPFENWRHFRMAYVRGEKATRPRYKASNAQITNQMKTDGQEILDIWSSKIRD
jgi:hypothetical protein